jgi:2-hydroxymuconate-semialdehyde hydrolase
MTTPTQGNNPEIGSTLLADNIQTNFHDVGSGDPVVLIHGSGPGVSAWANWRLSLPVLSQKFRVIAPDIVGFGFTERPAGIQYTLDNWVSHAVSVLDALKLDKVDLVGNSFGGAVSLALAVRHPDRVKRLVLMGSAGTSFTLTPALDEAWGYQPSIANMRRMLDTFAYDRNLVTDELAKLRYEAALRPGVQEAYAAMFPAPRQRWIDALASPDAKVRTLPHETLIIHGREDFVLPLSSSIRLHDMIPRSQLHVFGRCGHWTQIEHAGRFNRLVLDFLSEDA